MAASFPSAKKTFTTIVNGVTKLVAALFNTPDDEIEAIETFIGAMGRAQAYSESIKNLLSSYRRGCSVEYKGAADLYVRAGEIAIPDASGNLAYRKNTSDLTVTWADIDTGAEANSTLYYVYVVADTSATTFTVKISTNATTPSGYTYYKKIGQFYNNASGNIEYVSNVDSSSLLPSNTPIRSDYVIDTVYQNLSPKKILIKAEYGYVDENGKIESFSDSSNPPTTRVAYIYATGGSGTRRYVPFEFYVQPSHYFKITHTGTYGIGTIESWET